MPRPAHSAPAIGGLFGGTAYLLTLAGGGGGFGWLALLIAPVALLIGMLIGYFLSMAASSWPIRLGLILGAVALLISAAPRNGARFLMGVGLLLATVPPPISRPSPLEE